MITYLLEYFIFAEDVTVIIQGAGAVNKEGFTGLLGMPSFSNCLWKHPLCPCATAWDLPGTCLTVNSLFPVASLSELKDCLGPTSSLITLFNP